MGITGINPSAGPIAGRSMVTITGSNLPELADVYFGDRTAGIVSVVAPTFLVVNTPPGAAGFVDVTVVDRATGDQTTYEHGYRYVEEGQEPVTTTTTSTTTPTTATTTTGGVTETTIQVTTTMAAPTTSTSPVLTSTTLPNVAPDPTLDDWLDSVLRTPEGLTLAPPAADAAISRFPVELWAGALCDEPVCPGWVLER